MKKFLSLLVSCLLCFTAVSATACGEKTSKKTTQPIESLQIEDDNLLLTLGDKFELAVSYNPIKGETLTWTSSSPSVVSVDENGVVEALKVGAATISASYGSKQVSCRVEVSLSSNVPILVFDDSVSEEITLMQGAAFNLGAGVRFNGKVFDDAAIEYSVSDESVGTITDGKFVAKNVTGSTQISAYATWRGQTVHAKTITVNVIPESTVLLNEGKLTDIEIYMLGELAGQSYSTCETISSVYISENGTEITEYELFVADEGIATVEKSGNNWLVSPNKAGKTNLIVRFGDTEFPFALTVSRPVATFDKTVDFSLSDGKYFDEDQQAMQRLTEMIDGFSYLVSYVIDGKETKINNGAFNFPESESLDVILYNDNFGYQVTFNVYTTVIDELKDFENIYANSDTSVTVQGSYALAKDIIEPNTVLSMPAGKVASDFGGSFDGKGHGFAWLLPTAMR